MTTFLQGKIVRLRLAEEADIPPLVRIRERPEVFAQWRGGDDMEVAVREDFADRSRRPQHRRHPLLLESGLQARRHRPPVGARPRRHVARRPPDGPPGRRVQRRLMGYGLLMDGDERKIGTPEDGRPVEARQGQEPQPKDEAEEDIPDEETVESVGY